MPPKGWKKPKPEMQNISVTEKPKIGLPDPLSAAQEACRHAQEGNVKLARSMDLMRAALELIVSAEVDNLTHLPVTPQDLRQMALNALEGYSALTGQNWKRSKVITTRAGGTGNAVSAENIAFG